MNRKKFKFLHFIGNFFKYLIISSVFLIVLILILLTGIYRNLKNTATEGLNGRKSLSTAIELVKAKNWTEAQNKTNEAHNSFIIALENLNQSKSNIAIRYFTPLRTQINDLEYLLQTAEILSRSLKRILPLAEELDSIRSGSKSSNLNNLSKNDKKDFLQLIYESEPELNGLKANVELAILNLDKIHRLGILWPMYAEISNIKKELTETSLLMTKLSPVIRLLPALTGHPDTSRFLILLQNNDELRPSGGFIGTYGLIEIKNGEIISLKTDDSYHLDMPASQTDKWQTQAPEILKKYLKIEKWYLRDANWSPDWPTSAKKIQEIYNGERVAISQEPLAFTGIVAINPDLVSDLLKLVGPVELHGETYRSDNLQSLLQYNVEVAYKEQKISSWDRKDIINELMSEVKSRIFNLDSSRWNELFKLIDHNINTKNVQAYFNNDAWENLAKNIELSGEIKQSSGDYLMVVDANLGAFKSDAVVKKTISYNVIENDTELKSRLKLTYSHEGGFDWRTTRYRSYTRVYVPLGSQLLSIEGLDLSKADISTINDEKIHKTIFGFFLSVEPGKAQSIYINYNLPGNLKTNLAIDGYKLIVQKQSGRRLQSINVSFKPKHGEQKEWTETTESDQIYSTMLNK